jgi:hypothetical protein
MNKPLNLEETKKTIKEVLTRIELYGIVEAKLILGTIAVESDFGKLRRQIGFANKKGGGYGLGQIELVTHDWLVSDFLKKRQELKEQILSFYDTSKTKEENLILNDKYNIAICRLKYYSCPFKMPAEYEGIEAVAEVWKTYYNTRFGKGTEKEFIDKYNEYCK